jgi:hypothetical protein
MRMRCRGNPFIKQLPSVNLGITDVFTGRFQATHIPSRDRCVATSIHTTILRSPCLPVCLRRLFFDTEDGGTSYSETSLNVY